MKRNFFSLLILEGSDWQEKLDEGASTIIMILRYFYDVMIILIPILLLLLGTLDFLKATASQDEKGIKQATSALGKRFSMAALALLGLLIFRLVLSIFVGGSEWIEYWK